MDYSNSDFLRFPTDAKPALKSSFALNNSVKEQVNRKQFANKFVTKGLVSACALKSVSILDEYVILKSKFITVLVKMRNYIFVFFR